MVAVTGDLIGYKIALQSWWLRNRLKDRIRWIFFWQRLLTSCFSRHVLLPVPAQNTEKPMWQREWTIDTIISWERTSLKQPRFTKDMIIWNAWGNNVHMDRVGIFEPSLLKPCLLLWLLSWEVAVIILELNFEEGTQSNKYIDKS
jgi:hypothetical protein